MQFQGNILNNFRQVNIKKVSYLYLLDGLKMEIIILP